MQKLSAGGAKLSGAQYIYNENEAVQKFEGIVSQVNEIINGLFTFAEIRGNVKFAVAGKNYSPFQVSCLGNDDFVILIDHDAFCYLANLCARVQTLEPLAKFVNAEQKVINRDYKGKYLLDIAKDIAFYPENISEVISGYVHMTIFQAALMHIIAHEYAHILHGHFDFLNSTEFLKFAENDEDKALTRRALEMDADSSAASAVFDRFESFIHGRIIRGDWIDGVDDKLIRSHYLTGSFLSVIYLECLSSNLNPKYHPIGFARFLTISDVLPFISVGCPLSTSN